MPHLLHNKPTPSNAVTPAFAPRQRIPWQRIFDLARPELPLLLLATLFLTVLSVLGLLYPMAIKMIVNAFAGYGGRDAINQAALLLLILIAFQGLFTTVCSYIFTVAGERVVAHLRRGLYSTILRQEIAFFDEQRTGELLSRLTADTTALQSITTSDVAALLRHCVTVVGGMAVLLWTSWRLTLVMLAVVPAALLLAVAYGRIVRGLSQASQAALAHANEIAEETISGIRTVRAFAAEDSEARRYGEAVWDAFKLARRRALIGSVFSGVLHIAGSGILAAMMWYGGTLVLRGQLRVGDLMAFILYVMIVISSLSALSDLWTSFMQGVGASERVFELLDRRPALPSGSVQPAKVQGYVHFEQVDFAYPARPNGHVLQALDLCLRPGEVVAVVGHSGAGKSTIAALLSRFYDPQGGRILLDGHDLRALDPNWLRQQIGVVSQEPVLFATTIAENIRYGKPSATRQEIEAAAQAANAHDFISRTPAGYDTLVGERGVQLSGGQKQRIAIARAILKNPRILVLDEATSALDAESEALVQEALERLMRGRTTLMIAHRLSTVISADRVLVLNSGLVVQEGRHHDLIRKEGIYRRLVERQFAQAALLPDASLGL